MRVLVADDDFTSRTLVADVLREEGYEVVAVADGTQADAALRAADAPQIAVLDWMMPRMDGIEVVRQTRARPTDNPPYLILLTSRTGRNDLLTGFAAGVNDYLFKPFDLGELLARVAAGRRVVELQTALNDRLAAQRFQTQFHQIAAHISASLTAVLNETDFDQAINAALRQLGELFAADRSYLFRFTPDLAQISNSHEWVAPDVTPQMGRNQKLDADGLRWWKTRMLRKEPVQISDTAVLPPEAAAEKEMFLEQEIRSLLCLPTIGGDGQLTGFIGFDMVNRAYEWPPEQLAMLQPIADAVGATIERLRAKEALGESEIRYHSLFETAREAIFISDDNLRYLEVNQAACDLLGYSRAELQAMMVSDIVVDTTEVDEKWQTFVVNGLQENVTTLRAKDGRLIPVEYRAVANFTPGRHFSVVRDMSERKRYERELREAEHRYRALFDQAHDAVFMLDADGRHLAANQRAADMLGYSLEELLTLNLSDISAEPEKSAAIGPRLWAGEHIPTYERLFRRKDGRLIPVDLSVELVRDADGRPLHVQSVARDISARKKMEESLRDSESRLRSYIEDAPYGLFVADESGRYVEVNPAACAVTGYDEAELLNMKVGDLHLTADYAAAQGHFEQVQKTGFAVGEFAFQHKSGEMRYWLVNAVKLSPTRIMAFTQDITERHHSQEQLQQSEERFRSLVASLNDVVYTLDDQQRYTALYGKRVADLNVDPNRFLGRSLREIARLEVAAVHEEANARALAGESVLYDWSTMLDGEKRYYQTMVSPLRDQAGRVTGVVGVARNVTGQKETERELRQSHAELAAALQTLQDAQAQLIQQERLAAVGQLAAGIAHDFNNILAVILLYAQMMNRSSELPPWETEAVAAIERQTKTAAQLVQQILDFSRRSMMEKRTLDWLPLLKEQVRLLRHTLPDNITVTLQAAAEAYIVRADAARLQQMLLNLAINARDAMPDGGELRLELDKLDLTAARVGLTAGSWLRLRVSDTGQGITPEDSRHIFEPFFTTKPPGQGSGLGLSQAQGIVLQHNGRIEFATEVGQGATFTVYLPAVAGEAELAAAPVTVENGHRETVLLVEDSDIVRQALVASLQALNYEVTAVNNGREALEYLQANPDQADVIVSDMIMPVMGGAELFQQVQRLARSIPMVIITGHQMDEELDELVAQGLVGWLMKPIDFDGLANLLEKALRQTAAQSGVAVD